jgi:hypothetical protein
MLNDEQLFSIINKNDWLDVYLEINLERTQLHVYIESNADKDTQTYNELQAHINTKLSQELQSPLKTIIDDWRNRKISVIRSTPDKINSVYQFFKNSQDTPFIDMFDEGYSDGEERDDYRLDARAHSYEELLKITNFLLSYKYQKTIKKFKDMYE